MKLSHTLTEKQFYHVIRKMNFQNIFKNNEENGWEKNFWSNTWIIQVKNLYQNNIEFSIWFWIRSVVIIYVVYYLALNTMSKCENKKVLRINQKWLRWYQAL